MKNELGSFFCTGLLILDSDHVATRFKNCVGGSIWLYCLIYFVMLFCHFLLLLSSCAVNIVVFYNTFVISIRVKLQWLFRILMDDQTRGYPCLMFLVVNTYIVVSFKIFQIRPSRSTHLQLRQKDWDAECNSQSNFYVEHSSSILPFRVRGFCVRTSQKQESRWLTLWNHNTCSLCEAKCGNSTLELLFCLFMFYTPLYDFFYLEFCRRTRRYISGNWRKKNFQLSP